MKMNWDNLFWTKSECVRPERPERGSQGGGKKEKKRNISVFSAKPENALGCYNVISCTFNYNTDPLKIPQNIFL